MMRKDIDLGFRIKAISDLMEQQANGFLKEYDLTASQMKVLHYLYRINDHKARLKELEKFFRVSQPTMAGIAVRLEEKGFISGSTDPEDKRIKIVALSEKGNEVCQETIEKRKRWKEEYVQALGEENEKQLCSLLDQFYACLNERKGRKKV